MSIIRKASEYRNNSAVVFGLPSTGKSTLVAKTLYENALNPLWIVSTNADLVAEEYPDWDIAQIPTWNEFERFYLEMVEGKIDLSPYDALVIEGLGIISTMALVDILAKSETKDPRPSYLEMGRVVASRIAGLRGMFKTVFVTLDLQRNEKDEIEQSINPYLYNSIIGFFSRRWYTYTEPSADKKSAVYLVQTDPTLAIRFRTNKSKAE